MASTTLLYAVVGNIPRSYHSSDLRNFFSRLIETGAFDCFHFRHRPEARETERKPGSSSECTQDTQETHGTSKNLKLPDTRCCVIRLPESQFRDLEQMYNCRHWINEKGESMRSPCRISKIKLSSKSPDDSVETQYKTRLEQSLVSPDREEFYEEDLKNLIELHPPTVMPKGNVGTPTPVFLDLIRQCLLPPKIISKLKLKFPKFALNKKYGNVPFDYEDSGQDQEAGNVCWLPVTSGSGHELQLEETAEKEPNGTVRSKNDARDESVRVVGNGSVGAKQRTSDCVMLVDSDQRIEEGGERERRNREVEAERVEERGEIEEEGESDHEEEEKEGLDEGENRNSERKIIEELEGDQEEEKRNQWEEKELQREGKDEEMEDIERENGSTEEKEKRREETEGPVKNNKTNNQNLKGQRLFGEVNSRGHQPRKQSQEKTKEDVKMLNNEKMDEETIRKKKKEFEKFKAKEKKKREMAVRRKKMALRIEEKMIEFERGSDHSEDDADECQEWERHEALHDDPSNQERNEERLFEQEIELKWEKGGSGLVFYTDAQFWKQQEGDFDEQTADDWDVDISGYYDPGSGDMDGRDLIRIRRDQRRRDGMEDDDGMVAGIGKFEKHTKGFGRKMMERHGWKDGEGLGSSASGISEALENDGQNPRCKTGFGFQEPKRGKKSYRRQELHEWHGPIISTVYDDPSVTDPVDPLLRRNEPYQLKRRKNDVTES